MKLFFIFIILIGLIGCSDSNFPAPACRIAESQQAHIDAFNDSLQAACIIRLNHRLLSIERSNGLYDLAYSKNISLQALDELANASDSVAIDSMQCAAHQAMWQQTGFNVEVGPLVATQKDGSLLYACNLEAGYDGTEDSIEAPPWQVKDVNQLIFIQPFEIELDQWQRPDEFSAMRDAFVFAREVSQIHHINTSD